VNEENTYRKTEFLSELFDSPNYTDSRNWKDHQEMQMNFLRARGLNQSSVILDMGCGPLRLGASLIPLLEKGWYYGIDINQGTLNNGLKVLEDHKVTSNRYTLICNDNFCTENVDRLVDIAFSNSLFSHLSLNSILTCLMKVRSTLKDGGVYYSTFFSTNDCNWLETIERTKWGKSVLTYPNKDPYHYPSRLLNELAVEAGFKMTIEPDFGHPTQTMARFAPE
jgi:cyclopropane fatty-acyl-phospholipid synthase-like methyltransferase